MPLPDPHLFDPKSIPQQTKAFNQKVIELQSNAPDPWSFTPQEVRQARRDGKGMFPLEAFDKQAECFEIEGDGGAIPMRVIKPDNQTAKGVFLHIHGGGWMYGANDLQDMRLKQLANETGLDCLSVEYRLTPEHAFPECNEDCERAALWLCQNGHERFNTGFLSIGGESAGAHLAVDTLLRLRDKHYLTPFHAALLVAGVYDLSCTPSARNFHHELILHHADLVKYIDFYLQNGEDRTNPAVSPLYADLNDMPPAHFSVGTMDALLDDSLFMANRWQQFQAQAELDIYPGGCHVFQYMDELDQAHASRKAMAQFLLTQMETT